MDIALGQIQKPNPLQGLRHNLETMALYLCACALKQRVPWHANMRPHEVGSESEGWRLTIQRWPFCDSSSPNNGVGALW